MDLDGSLAYLKIHCCLSVLITALTVQLSYSVYSLIFPDTMS